MTSHTKKRFNTRMGVGMIRAEVRTRLDGEDALVCELKAGTVLEREENGIRVPKTIHTKHTHETIIVLT